MKKLILLIILICTSGCGLQNQINDLKDRAGTDEGAINDLKSKINTLETETSTTVTLLNSVLGNVFVLQDQVSTLQVELASAATQNQINLLQSQINTLDGIINSVNSVLIPSLESTVNNNTVSIATLMGYKNIVDFKDPCGSQGSYNEIFLHLSDGGYVASFSDNANGKNTRFARLTDGNFVTTDGTSCFFTVSGNGTIISNEHN